jgi:hypothetical protein
MLLQILASFVEEQYVISIMLLSLVCVLTAREEKDLNKTKKNLPYGKRKRK